MKTKKSILRTMAAVIATVIAISPILGHAKVSAWGTPIRDGTIHMTHNSKCAELYHSGNPGENSNCNAKAVVQDGHWIPVYCIEKGKYLNDTDYVTASMYTNSTWNDKYNMSVRDAIGMIYVCGFNGENGWGTVEQGIFNHDADDATLMANSNYHKYVATQALIWEVITGNTYYSHNSSVQGAIDTLRARIRNYQNRESVAANKTGSISVYKSASEAQSHKNTETSVVNGVGHFAYGYTFYTPKNFVEQTNWNHVSSSSVSDFTTSVQRDPITLGWTRVYGNSAEAGQAGQTVYTLDANDASNRWGVILWSPDNGNQLTISATASSEKVYASFEFSFERDWYQAGATFNTTKFDDQGNPARGATFTVYKSNGSVLGTMTDTNKDGHYSISIQRSEFADEANYYYDMDNNAKPITTPITRTFTVKETSPATEVYVNGAWTKRTFAQNNETYTINISIDRSSGKMTWTATGTNGGTATRSGRTTSGNIYFGTANQGGKVINYQLVNANANFKIKKEDERGNVARGATFGVFTDAACTKKADVTLTDSDNDGIYNSSTISWSNQTRSSSERSAVYYIKELTPATEVYQNGAWIQATCELDPTPRTVRVVWNSSKGEINAYFAEGAVSDLKASNATITQKGTFNGTTSTVSADFTSKPWKNTPYVHATASFSMQKVDNLGRQARGAEFTVYSDAECTEALGTMVDAEENGHYAFSDINMSDVLRTGELQELNLYIKETVPASEIYFADEWISIDCEMDLTVRKVTITWNPNTGEIQATLTVEDEEVAKAQGVYDELSFTSSVDADFSEVPVVNKITSTGAMRIEKYDEATGERLSGATFRVYTDINADGALDEEDTVFCEALTDDDNDGVYVLDGMPLDQHYIVKEIDAPQYYETDPNTYAFELTPVIREVVIDNADWNVVEGVEGEFLNRNPIVGTTLTDAATQEHVTIVSDEITLVDTVSYKGLHVGESYVMTGTLYDKTTGEALKDENGEEITSYVTFVPAQVEGTVDVSFTLNTEVLRNKTIVAAEKVRHEESEKWVGIHFDLEDQAQTVYVPNIHTTLTDNVTKDHIVADQDVELTDVVAYENLVPELEYTVTGYLMDKNTNEPLKNEAGEMITSSTTFTPSEASGEIDVTFHFSRTLIDSTELVAFEDIYYMENLIVSHHDIEDKDQKVVLPKIGTIASVDGEKEFFPDESITLIDIVSYENLIPGKTYEVRGQIMKTTGEPYAPQAQAIVGTTRFTPNEANGTVEVAFTFWAKDLKAEDKLVVFEDLYLVSSEVDENGQPKENLVRIASHEDVTDEDQTVTVKEIPVTPPVPATGDTSDPTGSILIGLLAILAGGAIAFVALKNRIDD